MRDSTTAILSGLLGALIVSAATWWIGRSRPSPSLERGRHICAYGNGARAFVVLLSVLLPSLVLHSYFRGKADLEAVLLVLGFTVVFAGYQGTEFFQTRIEYDDENIYAFSPWRKDRVIPLKAFGSSKHSGMMYWTAFQTEGFGTVRIHDWLHGATQLVSHIQGHRIDR